MANVTNNTSGYQSIDNDPPAGREADACRKAAAPISGVYQSTFSAIPKYEYNVWPINDSSPCLGETDYPLPASPEHDSSSYQAPQRPASPPQARSNLEWFRANFERWERNRAAIFNPPVPGSWEDLKYQTDTHAPIDPPVEVDSRFNIACARKTAVYIKNSDGISVLPIHANRMGEGITDQKNIIASQLPYTYYWNAVYQERTAIEGENYLILDLTAEEERTFYPEEGTENQASNVNVRLASRNGQLFTYELSPKDPEKASTTLQRLHFNQWPDHGVISVEDLHSLVLQIEDLIPGSNDGLWVHCRAGVGRTGTLIAALIIKEQIKKGLISLDHFERAVIDIIVALRQQRSESMVQNRQQFILLLDYTKSLLK